MKSWVIVDANTGARQQEVTPSAGDCRSVMNGFGDGSHTFQLLDATRGFPRDMMRDLTQPWKRVLVECWDGVPRYAGLILKRDYDRDRGTVTVQHAELEVIFSRRFPFGVDGYAAGTRTFTGKSLRGLVRAVALEILGPKSPRWGFPVVFPADEAGSLSRTWENYNLKTGEQMLAELVEIDGGPDVHFQPRWSASGSLEWLMKIGSPRIPGATFDWSLPHEGNGAASVTVTEDATRQLTGVIGVGDGSGPDIQLGFAGELAGSDIPYLDTRRSFKGSEDAAVLNGLAMGELKAFREPTTQIDFTVQASAYPGFDKLDLGCRPRLEFRGDPFTPDGWKEQYLIGFSSDVGNETIKLEVQAA